MRLPRCRARAVKEFVQAVEPDASGSYFPPLVQQVEIPKTKVTRKFGIPTVPDRIAQATVKLLIEPVLDPVFHPDSYGYRLGKSAKQAVAVTRKRCRQYDSVVEFDIKAPFGQIDHALLMKAVRRHIKDGDYWVLYRTAMHAIFQYVDTKLERWARRKYKTLSRRKRRSAEWLRTMAAVYSRVRSPMSLGHRLVDGSRMRPEPQVRFCKRLAVKSLGPTSYPGRRQQRGTCENANGLHDNTCLRHRPLGPEPGIPRYHWRQFDDRLVPPTRSIPLSKVFAITLLVLRPRNNFS
jgi:hypothetical protein